MKKLLVAVALMCVAPAAVAADEAARYWGLNVGNLEFKPDGIPGSYKGGLGSLFLGHELTSHFAIEARFGVSSTMNDTVFGTKVDTEIEHIGSLLTRLNVLTGDIRPYVLLGGSYSMVRMEVAGSSEREDDSGFTWGGGVSVHAGNFGMQLEYVRYLDTDDATLQGINLGALWHF